MISNSNNKSEGKSHGKLVAIRVRAVRRYAFKPEFPGTKGDKRKKKIGEVYDLDSYLRARKHGGNPILKGYLRPDARDWENWF